MYGCGMIFLRRASLPWHPQRLRGLLYPLEQVPRTFKQRHPWICCIHTERHDQLSDSELAVLPPLPALSWDTVRRALIGNVVITCFKFGVFAQTGSSAMLSEAIHTLADSGNQVLLLMGLQQASSAPDAYHQYGYGRAAFFWALVSALGMFATGAGVALWHGGNQLISPPELYEAPVSMWTVLAVSFAVDGWVLTRTLQEIVHVKPTEVSLLEYLRKQRDPFVLAVVMEDFAACTGVLIASLGIGLTHFTGDVFWDSAASVGVGGLLGVVAIRLIRMNQQYLMGQSVEPEILDGIRSIISNRDVVDGVRGIQSQWVGPSTFAYKAEVDFDGTFLASQLHSTYGQMIAETRDLRDVEVLMSWYAEDVTRVLERELRSMERQIRARYPEAAYIEIEPASTDSNLLALPGPLHKHDAFVRNAAAQAERAEIEKLRLSRVAPEGELLDEDEAGGRGQENVGGEENQRKLRTARIKLAIELKSRAMRNESSGEPRDVTEGK